MVEWRPYSLEELQAHKWDNRNLAEGLNDLYNWSRFKQRTFMSPWWSVETLLEMQIFHKGSISSHNQYDKSTMLRLEKSLQELYDSANTNPSDLPKKFMGILKENIRLRQPYRLEVVTDLTIPDERCRIMRSRRQPPPPSFEDYCAGVTQLRGDLTEKGHFSQPAKVYPRKTNVSSDDQLNEYVNFVLLSWKFQHHFQTRSLEIDMDLEGYNILEWHCGWDNQRLQ